MEVPRVEKIMNQILAEADIAINKGDLETYLFNIRLLFKKISCDCFIEGHQETLEKHLKIINSLFFDGNSFEYNLACGFLKLYSDIYEPAPKIVLFRANEDKTSAIYHLKKAIDLKDNDDLCYSLASKAEFKSKSKLNKQSCLEYAHKAVNMNPSANNYFALGQAQGNCNKFNEAIHSFLAAIDLNNNFPHAYRYIYRIYLWTREYERAKEYAQLAISRFNDKWSYYYYSKILIGLQDYKAALKYSKKGLNLFPSERLFNLLIAEILEHMGEIKESLHMYEIVSSSKIEESEYARNQIKRINKIEIARKLQKASDFYDLKDYKKSIEWYEQVISEIEKSHIRKYLSAKVKLKHGEIQIDTIHPIYKRLEELMELASSTKYDPKLSFYTQEYRSVKNIKEYYEDDLIKFGKYKGEILEEIIYKDAEYILWCIINLDHFFLYNKTLIRLFASINENNSLLEEAVLNNLLKSQFYYNRKPDNYWEEHNVDHDGDFNINNTSDFYNDSLDMDQQSPEFWDRV